MQSSSPADHIYFLTLFYLIATFQGKEGSEILCPPNFKTHSGTGEKNDLKCYLLMGENNQTSWERAQKSCREISSFLLDSRFLNATELQEVLKGKDVQKIWIGIKRMAGFYAWQTSSFELFRESDKWGTKWGNEDVLTEDCVALNVSSGNLIDANCSNELPYVCMNYGFSTKPVQLPFCPPGWVFSYHLAPNSDLCIRVFYNSTNDTASSVCRNYRGHLITLKDYGRLLDNLFPSGKPETYWLDDRQESGRVRDQVRQRAKTDQKYSDSSSSQFICKIPQLPINISVSISQSDPSPIRSSNDLPKTLTCDVFINGNASDPSQQEFITYQWMKDGIPLQVHNSTIYLSVVEDDTNQNLIILNKQGKYQCKVLIRGLGEYISSEEFEIYFSDVSRYAFVIEDNPTKIPFNQVVDFSRANFSHFLDLFRQPMDNALSNLTNDDSTLLPSVDWDFQNISITKEKVKLTFQLYLNGTEDDKKPENEIRIRMLLQQSLFSVFNTQWNLSPRSMSLILSDTSINSGYPTVCNNDYEPLLNDWCYKLIDEEMSWNDATEACGKNYSYLFSNIEYKIPESAMKAKYVKLQDIFNQLGEFWVAGRRINGLFQWEGITPKTMAENTELIWAMNEPKDEYDCASIANVSSQNFVVKSRNCSQKMKYLCIHQKVEISNMSSCEDDWKGTLVNDKCYLKMEETMKWQDAKEYCATENSRLLTLPDFQTYNLIKTFIRSFVFDGIGWWIGLQRKGSRYEWQDGKLVNLTFAEWSRNISFSEQNSTGALTLNPTDNSQSEVKWNLFDPNEEKYFICEKNQIKNPPEATVDLKIQKKYKVKKIDELNIELEIPLFICEAQHSLYGSVVWYRNDVAFEGDRGKHWKNTFFPESSNPKNLFQSQGYYSCSVEQQSPFKSIKSSSVLYQDKGVETFATTMFSSVVFSELHRNMSRGDFWTWSNETEIEKELAKILENILIVNLKNLTVNSSGSEFLFHLYDIEKREKEQSDVDMSPKIIDYFTGSPKDAVRKNIVAWLASYSISQATIQVKSTNACPQSQTTNSQGVLLTWPRTLVNSSTQPKEGCFSVQMQPIVRRCILDFETGAYWDEPEDCQTFHVTLGQLSQLEINSTNVLDTVEKLSQLSSQKFDLNSTDIHFIATTMRSIANVSGLNSSVLQEVSVVASNLLTSNKSSVLEAAQDDFNSLSIITESLEIILSNTEMEASSIKLEEPAIAMQSWKLSEYSSNHLPLGLLSECSSDVDKQLKTTDLFNISDVPVDGILTGILLPVDLVNNRSAADERLNVIFYGNPSLFLHIQGPSDKFIINSPVIYASFKTEVRNLTSPVQMVMQPLDESLLNRSKAICVYVRRSDTSENWAEDGCSLQLINNSYVCHCNHLTNFAVLTSMYSHTMEPDIPLSIISYIGCGLSIIGLTVTIMTYVLFRSWRKGNNHKIICNLSVGLLSVMLIFTIGIERTEPKLGCTIVAVLLHYSLLASFCWMLVEALDLYLKLVKVLSTYISRFMRKAIIFAWGLPLVIVTIVLLASPSAYDSQMRYCWLSAESFFCAFAIPVIILLLTNFVIFCSVMHSICKKDIQNNQDDQNIAIKRFRAAVCIYFLLGFSWLFGFLAINEAKVVFQYLFAITTTAQGFFIFVFFVLRDESSRKMWYELFHSSSRGNTHSLHSTGNLSSYNNRKFS